MNNDQLWAYGRQVLTIFGTMIGTWLVATGKITKANLDTLSGGVTTIVEALFTIGPIALSVYHNFDVHSLAGKLRQVQDEPKVAKVELHSGQDANKLAQPLSKVSVVGG